MATEKKELRKMRRIELIEIIYALQQNGRVQEKRISELEAELENRRICVGQAGSIAEAALGLNQIFSDAQAAADQYLLSVSCLEDKIAGERDSILDEARQQAAEILAEAEKELTQAKARADRLVNAAQEEQDRKFAETEASISRMWEDFCRKMARSLIVNKVPLSALLPDQPEEEGGLDEGGLEE